MTAGAVAVLPKDTPIDALLAEIRRHAVSAPKVKLPRTVVLTRRGVDQAWRTLPQRRRAIAAVAVLLVIYAGSFLLTEPTLGASASVLAIPVVALCGALFGLESGVGLALLSSIVTAVLWQTTGHQIGEPILRIGGNGLGIVALVGVGAAAQINHLPALQKLEDVKLAALCDRDPEKAARVAQKFGVPASYTRFEELLADDAIDAVDITTPNYLHAPMAVAALEAGKHVLCERPLARSGAEAAAMAKAAKKADRLLMCALQHRFRPDAQLLRKFVDKGDLGDIFLAKGGWLRQKT